MLAVSAAQARACAFEIGVHNSTIAMTIAITVLGNTTIAIPAAVYSLFMYFLAASFGMLLNKFEGTPKTVQDDNPIKLES